MQIDNDMSLEEMNIAFDAYERALVSNDANMLDQLFWNHSNTLRYGATENLVGYDAIQHFRAGRPANNLARQITSRHITSFGDNFAVANITFIRPSETRIGRQSQSWVKFDEGWRIVAAHVSWMSA